MAGKYSNISIIVPVMTPPSINEIYPSPRTRMNLIEPLTPLQLRLNVGESAVQAYPPCGLESPVPVSPHRFRAESKHLRRTNSKGRSPRNCLKSASPSVGAITKKRRKPLKSRTLGEIPSLDDQLNTKVHKFSLKDQATFYWMHLKKKLAWTRVSSPPCRPVDVFWTPYDIEDPKAAGTSLSEDPCKVQEVKFRAPASETTSEDMVDLQGPKDDNSAPSSKTTPKGILDSRRPEDDVHPVLREKLSQALSFGELVYSFLGLKEKRRRKS